jgi:hypothetical protein
MTSKTAQWSALILLGLLPLLAAGEPGTRIRFSPRFARYSEYTPAVPVYVMSGERTLHRFFEVRR